MPSIEHRRIYRAGQHSFAIILPKGWLAYMGLQAGDFVEILVDGDLVISSTHKVKPMSGKVQQPEGPLS